MAGLVVTGLIVAVGGFGLRVEAGLLVRVSGFGWVSGVSWVSVMFLLMLG